jgi:membrane fusion protein
LAKILPDGADLIAEIFVPVPQSGYLKKNHAVILQYDAYPAAHFGFHKARISDIGSSIMMEKEEDKPFAMKDPYYKVQANLQSQWIKVYGKNKLLSQGMTFSAWILGPKRKLWQWVLSPLYSRYGKVIA